MEFETAHEYIRTLLPRIRRCPGWDIRDRDTPDWYRRALSSVALLTQTGEVKHVTGDLTGGRGELHLFTKHAVITLDVTVASAVDGETERGTRRIGTGGFPVDSDNPTTTVTMYLRSGLRSIDVGDAASISGGPEHGYYWPGAITAVARYADDRTITFTRREGSSDDLVTFLPELLADLATSS